MSDDWNKKGDGADGWVDEDIDPYARTEFGLDAVEGPPQQPPQVPHPPQPFQQPVPPPQPQSQQMRGQPPQQTQLAPQQQYAPKPKDPYDVEEGKAMALVAHCGVLVGLPTFLVPMLQRDNEFALHHAKAAAVNYIFFFMVMMLVVVTCGLAFFIIPLPYVPMLVGIVNAANGDRASGFAWGGLGESLFGGVQLKSDERQLLE